MKKKVFLVMGILGAVGVLSRGAGSRFAGGVSVGPLKNTCGCQALSTSGEYEMDEEVAIFQNKAVEYPLALREGEDLPAQAGGKEEIMGVVSPEILAQRWIEVDLSEQKLYGHEGDKVAFVFLISSGKWGRTPTGEFQIWGKYRYTKMSGGSRALHTYYYLPNVPYTQYFYKDFGLHGTYWHNNFGQPMSHGCINLSIPDAEKLFWWTLPLMTDGERMIRATGENPGTRVLIHD